MKELFLAAGCCCLVLSVPTLAMTDEECAAMWKQADVNNDGSLSGAEASRHAAWMRVKDKTVAAESTINKAQFLDNCKSDVFTTAAVDPGAPLEGANSFTEGQAQDRILAAGCCGLQGQRRRELVLSLKDSEFHANNHKSLRQP
jgi:hypothetical protein